MGALVGVILAINLYGNAIYLLKLSDSPLERPVTIRIFEENEELTGGDVLPDFRCRVADLFALPGQTGSPAAAQ